MNADVWKVLKFNIQKSSESLRTDLGSLRREIEGTEGKENGKIEILKNQLRRHVDILDYVLATFFDPLQDLFKLLEPGREDPFNIAYKKYLEARKKDPNLPDLKLDPKNKDSPLRTVLTLLEEAIPEPLHAFLKVTTEVLPSLIDTTSTTIPRLTDSANRYIENLLADKAEELRLISHAYWSLRTAITQRINAVDDVDKKMLYRDIGRRSMTNPALQSLRWEPSPIIEPYRAKFLELVDAIIDTCYTVLAANLDKNTFAHELLTKTPRPIAYFEKRDIECPLQIDGIILTSGIGIPLTSIKAFWSTIATVHEVGHDFDHKFALSSYYLRNLINDKLKTQDSEIKEIWLGWLCEILADVIGILLSGSAYVSSLFSMLLQLHGLMIGAADDGEHPQSYIRGLIAIKVLELTLKEGDDYYNEYRKIIDELEALWTTNTFIPKVEVVKAGPRKKEYRLSEITAPMEDYLKLILDRDNGLEPFGGKSLCDLIEPLSGKEQRIIDEITDALLLKDNLTEDDKNQLKAKMNIGKDAPRDRLYIIAASHRAFLKTVLKRDRDQAFLEKNDHITRIHKNTRSLLEPEKQGGKRDDDHIDVEQLIQNLKETAERENLTKVLKKVIAYPGPAGYPPWY